VLWWREVNRRERAVNIVLRRMGWRIVSYVQWLVHIEAFVDRTGYYGVRSSTMLGKMYASQSHVYF
jgi:hypothetical protein